MFKYSFFIFLIVLFFSCSSNKAQEPSNRDTSAVADTLVFTDHLIDTVKSGINFIPKGNYSEIKRKTKEIRAKFYETFINIESSGEKALLLDSARQYFTATILNEIFPYWYGTVWDFNGYTNKPNDGVIACGYFISTTLKHTGVNMNRYKFAQQAGMNGAKTLDPSGNYIIYSLNSTEELDSVYTKIEHELKPGLYSVGLSNHVGFIYIKDQVAYFIHSNYIDGYVMTEKARYSDAFRSMVYVITDITYNDYLIESWITNAEIPVVTD